MRCHSNLGIGHMDNAEMIENIGGRLIFGQASTKYIDANICLLFLVFFFFLQ